MKTIYGIMSGMMAMCLPALALAADTDTQDVTVAVTINDVLLTDATVQLDADFAFDSTDLTGGIGTTSINDTFSTVTDHLSWSTNTATPQVIKAQISTGGLPSGWSLTLQASACDDTESVESAKLTLQSGTDQDLVTGITLADVPNDTCDVTYGVEQLDSNDTVGTFTVQYTIGAAS